MVIASIKDEILKWWEGKYIPPEPNDPDCPIVFISVGYYERHWSAKFVSTLIGFYRKHWQWIWSTIIAVASLYAAILALK